GGGRRGGAGGAGGGGWGAGGRPRRPGGAWSRWWRAPPVRTPCIAARSSAARRSSKRGEGTWSRPTSSRTLRRRWRVSTGRSSTSSRAKATVARIAMLRGDPATAEREGRAVNRFYRGIGDLGHLSSYAPELADAIYAQGRAGEAMALAGEAESVSIDGATDAECQ